MITSFVEMLEFLEFGQMTQSRISFESIDNI